MNHILSGKQFANKDLLERIFKEAEKLEAADVGKGMPKALAGKVVATVFYETSTRTRLSFEAAALKLGAGVISIADPKTSSAVKGESLEDAIRVISGYCDAVVLRHPQNGAAESAARVSQAPVINAGDGFNEHPTQALLDLYAMQKELGRMEGLKIAFLADFRFQRNIHSLVPIFSVLKDLRLYLIAPKELRLPDQYRSELSQGGVKFQELDSVEPVLPEIDVLYVTRVFKERFAKIAEYERLKKVFFVSPDMLARMKEKSIILHVMPRVYEIDRAVDLDSRAAYFRQAKNGLFVRAALLLYALGKL